MTLVRYIPITLEGGKIVYNKGNFSNIFQYMKSLIWICYTNWYCTVCSVVISNHIVLDLELLESSLEYEETFEENFGTKSCNELKDLNVKQKSKLEDTCENRKEKSSSELNNICSEASCLDSFPVTSTPVIDKFDSALKSVSDRYPTSIFPVLSNIVD